MAQARGCRFRTAVLAALWLWPAAGLGQVLVSSGSGSGLRLWYPASNDWWLDPSQGGRLNLVVNGGRAAPVVSYQANGNVGIGTTSPAGSLQVVSPAASPTAVIISTGAAVSQYLAAFATAGGLSVKADGANFGPLQLAYSTTTPAGYYPTYAP